MLDHPAFLWMRVRERGKVQRWVVPSSGFPGRKWSDPAVILGVPQSSLVSISPLFPYFATPHLAVFFSLFALPIFMLLFLSCFGTETESSRFLAL